MFSWLCWVFVAALGLSPVVARGGYSLVAVHGLLVGGVSLVVEHGFQAHGLRICSSQALELGVSSCGAQS